jgi:O-antigen/teichoic acid export membrane protein
MSGAQAGPGAAGATGAAPRGSGFVEHSAVVIIGQGVSAVLSMVYASLLGRWLGPGDYGTVAAALSLVYLFPLLLGPLETGVTRFAAAAHGESNRLRLWAFVIGALRRLRRPLLIGALSWLLIAPLLRGWLRLEDAGAIAAIAAYGTFSAPLAVLRGTLRGDHRFLSFGLNQVVESGLRLLMGGALVLLGWGASGAVGGYALGVAGAGAFALLQLDDLRRAPQDGPAPAAVGDAGTLWAFSLPVFFVYLYFQLATSIDMIAAKHWLPRAEAGLYGAAGTLSRVPLLVATPLYQVSFSHVTALTAGRRRRAPLVLAVVGATTLGLLCSLAIPWLLGAHLLGLLFGPGFVGAQPPLLVLWLATSVLALETLGAFVLLGMGRTEGAWAFILPCALLAAALSRFHSSGMDIALCVLAAAVSGLPVVATMVYRAVLRQKQVRLKDTAQGTGGAGPPPPLNADHGPAPAGDRR